MWYYKNSLNSSYNISQKLKCSSENEMHWKIVTMKDSPKLSYKTLLQSPLIGLNGKVINKNTVFGILHGSENTTFVYILHTEYSNIWTNT